MVVNCFQILYIRSLNTMPEARRCEAERLWIAFRFCIFVLWTQYLDDELRQKLCCELLSDFVYSFFEHNRHSRTSVTSSVVNCFQILYIRSLNTILDPSRNYTKRCELLSDFVYSFFEHNLHLLGRNAAELWIAFRFCIFVLWTQCWRRRTTWRPVVNCFQILYIRSLNTIWPSTSTTSRGLWIAFRFCIFVLWTQSFVFAQDWKKVVNCFQILYIRSLNTIVFILV